MQAKINVFILNASSSKIFLSQICVRVYVCVALIAFHLSIQSTFFSFCSDYLTDLECDALDKDGEDFKSKKCEKFRLKLEEMKESRASEEDFINLMMAEKSQTRTQKTVNDDDKTKEVSLENINLETEKQAEESDDLMESKPDLESTVIEESVDQEEEKETEDAEVESDTDEAENEATYKDVLKLIDARRPVVFNIPIKRHRAFLYENNIEHYLLKEEFDEDDEDDDDGDIDGEEDSNFSQKPENKTQAINIVAYPTKLIHKKRPVLDTYPINKVKKTIIYSMGRVHRNLVETRKSRPVVTSPINKIEEYYFQSKLPGRIPVLNFEHNKYSQSQYIINSQKRMAKIQAYKQQALEKLRKQQAEAIKKTQFKLDFKPLLDFLANLQIFDVALATKILLRAGWV